MGTPARQFHAITVYALSYNKLNNVVRHDELFTLGVASRANFEFKNRVALRSSLDRPDGVGRLIFASRNHKRHCHAAVIN